MLSAKIESTIKKFLFAKFGDLFILQKFNSEIGWFDIEWPILTSLIWKWHFVQRLYNLGNGILKGWCCLKLLHKFSLTGGRSSLSFWFGSLMLSK